MKSIVEKMPRPIGSFLRFIPYEWRLGTTFSRSRREIKTYRNYNTEQALAFILERIRKRLTDTTQANEFYREFYKEQRFNPKMIIDFEDLHRIPLVTRNRLQASPIHKRSTPAAGCLLTNTGGSSGTPLSFYLDRNAFAREWAHMHWIWAIIGYRQTDLKLTLRGRDLGRHTIRYNPVHNEFLVNHYKPSDEQADAVSKIAEEVKYIHGYPSAIYAFIRYCKDNHNALLGKFSKNLKGILLGSEYPAPVYRKLIEETLNVPSISWYGHSEMAVLAYETEKGVYSPMQTYGFCEAVKCDDNEYHLVGTSYHNNVSPFIRYDTDDIIEPEIKDGLLKHFRIKSGRIGDFIKDKNGQNISLTALLFGRHHPLFDWARFVQVSQSEPGKATIHIAIDKQQASAHPNPEDDFFTNNSAIDFEYKIQQEPYYTTSGKTPLLIPKECINR